MKTISSLLLAALILVVSACNNTDDEDYLSGSNQIRIVQDENHKTIAEYTYDRKGRLKNYWEKPEFTFNNEVLEFNYYYNSKSQLSSKEGYIPGNPIMSSWIGAMGKDVTESYEYDNHGRLKKVITSYKFPETTEYDFTYTKEYEYTDNQTIKMVSKHNYNETTTPISLTEYVFDNKGNLTELKSFNFEGGQLKQMYYSEKFQYDSRHNPFRYSTFPELFSPNNVIEKETTYYNTDGSSTSTFTYEYTYNRKGYPTMQKLTNPNKTTVVKYFKY